MPKKPDNFQLFNLETMSGVHPGTRTAVMQRLQVRPLQVQEDSVHRAEPDYARRWARLLWYDAPVVCDLHLQQEGETDAGNWEERPLLRLFDPLADDFLHTLEVALARADWQLRACGSCRHWQALAEESTADGLPLGRCGWHPSHPNEQRPMRPALAARQSGLALGCRQWQFAPEAKRTPAVAAEERDRPHSQSGSEQAQSSSTLWARLKEWFGRSQPAATSQSGWEAEIEERSGVGAGTESCFACQGRIANLGALTVATDEDDKRTFSVWRCRRCHTYYLNDWIDRWERLNSLETEERYYRLAPAEALAVLAVIEGVSGGDHPAGRHDRSQQRRWLEEYVADRPPLSHQIKQGR